MTSSKGVICVLLVAVVLCVVSFTPSQAAMVPCPSCADEHKPVWATDGQSCQEYHNACLLESINCNRLNGGQSAYRRISQAECEAMGQ